MEDPSVVNPVQPAILIFEPREHIVVDAVPVAVPVPVPENARVVDYIHPIHPIHQPRVDFRSRMLGIVLCCIGVSILIIIGVAHNYNYYRND
jgi:hypothetical protein